MSDLSTSAWRLVAVLAVAGGLRLSAAPAVVLIRGTASVPNAAEARYAMRATARVAAYLDDLGVAYRIRDDGALTAADLAACRVAVLTYNPTLPPAARAALTAHVQRGGRLMVFYSSDAELAALMRVRLGAYQADPSGAQWVAKRFTADAPAGVPDVVRQTSRSILPVTPLRGGKVIAWWEDRNGRRRQPAWVLTPVGLWMTHVLFDDADSWPRRRMLLALLGHLDPALWPDGARRLRARAETLGHFDDFATLRAAILDRDPAPDVRRRLDQAAQRRQAIAKLSADRDAARIALEAEGLYHDLLRTYAATFRAPPAEIRAVWSHDGLGLVPGNWPATAAVLAEHGVTDVFVNVLWPGRALYRGEVTPADPRVALHGDVLADAVPALRARGVRVHAWKVCWNLEGAPAAMIDRLRREQRLQRSRQGTEVRWMCPRHPDNARLEKDSLRELLRRYDVDGVHLDYIRYPDGRTCFCARCATAPAASRPEPITALVRDVAAFARVQRPGVILSAAVFGKYPECRDNVGQDWKLWLERGLLDYVVPMNYTTDLDVFRGWMTAQVAQAGSGRRVVAGIGVTAAESRLHPVDVLHQVDAAVQRGALGWALFDLNPVTAQEILPVLAIRR